MSNNQKAGKPFKNVFVVRFVSKYLFSKARAEEIRKACENQLSKSETLVINMKGVKDVTPGFANEAFGKLYLESRKRGASFKFFGTDDVLKPIILRGIQDAIKTQ